MKSTSATSSALTRKLVLTLLIMVLVSTGRLQSQVVVDDLYGPYLGQEPPGTEPQIFVPADLQSTSEWWWHGAPAFTPDGREFYLDVYFADQGIRVLYMEMNDADGRWTSPQPPAFAGSFNCASPSFTHDGNRVFFISDLPSRSIRISTRISDGWSASQEVHFPAPSTLRLGWSVSAQEDETLFARMQDSSLSTGHDIYRIRRIDGEYVQPERLDDNVNSPHSEVGVFVDPDGRFLILASDRPGGYGSWDLYISCRGQDGSWTPAQNLGEPVNSSGADHGPFVSADGRFLFFLSDRLHQFDRNPYWVDAQVVFDHIDPDDPEPPPPPRRVSGRRLLILD